MRMKLPDTRPSQTVKITWGNLDAYLIVGFYENNQPGEVFITIAKQGSFVSEMAGKVGQMASLLLQTGTPASKIVEKWEQSHEDSLFKKFAEGLRKAISIQGGQIDKDYNGE